MAAWIAEGRRRRLAIRDHSERVGRLPPLQSGEAERLVTSYFARRALAHRPPAAPVAAGLLSWLIIALGFFGLRMLMQERPQFVGQPMRSSMTELVQESPRIVMQRQEIGFAPAPTERVAEDIELLR